MLWLDGVLSIPTVGLLTATSFSRAVSLSTLVGKYADSINKEDKKVSLGQRKSFQYQISTPEGLLVTFTPNDFLFSYTYQRTEEKQPGELPVSRFDNLKSYSELLDDIIGHLTGLATIIPVTELEVERIGIVADADLKKDRVPPGVKSLLEHCSKPFGELEVLESNFVRKIKTSEICFDRCHVTIHMNNTAQITNFSLVLDWQRFEKKRFTSDSAFREYLLQCKASATAYFEKFARGEGFHEAF